MPPQSTRGPGTGLGHDEEAGKRLVLGENTNSLSAIGDVLWSSDMKGRANGCKIKLEDMSDASCTASSKAAVKSCTVTKRSLGSFAKALRTTASTALESVGTCATKEGGGLSTCCMAISVAVPSNGRRPAIHS